MSDPRIRLQTLMTLWRARLPALAGREDVLVFDSEPMAKDTEVTGPITAEIMLQRT